MMALEQGCPGIMSPTNQFRSMADKSQFDPEGDPRGYGLVFCFRDCDKLGPLVLTPDEAA
jgi:hypothetical protein